MYFLSSYNNTITNMTFYPWALSWGKLCLTLHSKSSTTVIWNLAYFHIFFIGNACSVDNVCWFYFLIVPLYHVSCLNSVSNSTYLQLQVWHSDWQLRPGSYEPRTHTCPHQVCFASHVQFSGRRGSRLVGASGEIVGPLDPSPLARHLCTTLQWE